jgi:hypothetical protein
MRNLFANYHVFEELLESGDPEVLYEPVELLTMKVGRRFG